LTAHFRVFQGELSSVIERIKAVIAEDLGLRNRVEELKKEMNRGRDQD